MRVWRAAIAAVVLKLIGMGSERRRINGMRETAVADRRQGLLIVAMLLMEGNVAIVLPQAGMVNESVTATRSEDGTGMEIAKGTEIGTVSVVENVTRTRTIAIIATKIVNAETDIAETRRNGSEEMVVGGREMVLDVAVVLRRMNGRYLLVQILHGIAPNPRAMKVLESDGVRLMMRYVALVHYFLVCLVIDFPYPFSPTELPNDETRVIVRRGVVGPQRKIMTEDETPNDGGANAMVRKETRLAHSLLHSVSGNRPPCFFRPAKRDLRRVRLQSRTCHPLPELWHLPSHPGAAAKSNRHPTGATV